MQSVVYKFSPPSKKLRRFLLILPVRGAIAAAGLKILARTV